MSDHLPKVICEDCAFKVDEFFNFRAKVLQTEDMFLQMMKAITKQEVNSLDHHIDIKKLRGNMDRLANGLDEIQNPSITRQNGIHSISTMDNIVLPDTEPVLAQEEITREDIEVADFHLDGDTVRLVDEQMREV